MIRFFQRLVLILCGVVAGLAGSEAAAVEFRFYRFSTVAVRTGVGTSVQLADFQFHADSGLVAQLPLITNPGGDNPEGEGPVNLGDFDPATKWLDFDRQPVVFDFGAPVEIVRYGFTTANDVSSRDPVRWLFEGSHDGSVWFMLDDRSGTTQSVSTERHFTHEWDLTSVTDLPRVDVAVSVPGVSSLYGVNITNGDAVTLAWEVEGASVVIVREGPTTLSTAVNGSVSVSPVSTTGYTVEAQNASGTEGREVVVYVDAASAEVELNEFASDVTTDGGMLDEDQEASDWIELHNPNPFAVSLEGYGLTDDASLTAPWLFPAGSAIEADSSLVVFASGKNRRVPGAEYHTDFALSKGGEFLALTDDGGSVLQVLDPFPPMFEDVSYGRRLEDGAWDHFTTPTPGAPNDTLPGPPGAAVTFLTPSSTFTTSIQVGLATDSATAGIRYTTDGSLPDETSYLYTGPITVTSTTLIKARTYETGRAPGEVAAAAYFKTEASVANFSSDLPVVVLENFASGPVPSERTLQAAQFSLFEPDALNGRTLLTSTPAESHRCGIKRRGSSTLNDPKGSYRVEFWQDGSDEEKDVGLLGLAEHDEWVLYAPYTFDRALVRNAFLFGLSNDLDRWAPKTRFCEVYLNTDGGALTGSDYQGVYVLMERISRDGDRVDVEKLTAGDNSEPEVTGGYILSIDRRDPEDLGFRSALGHPFDPPNASPQPWFNHVYPKEQNITPAQSGYIRGYIDDLESALYGPDFKDPETGYRAWLETPATIDHHLMVTFSKDPDALRLSTYLHKPRNAKLAFGPLWDFDRGMAPDNDQRAASPIGWDAAPERAEFFGYDYWGRLFQDPDFMQAWIDRWQELRPGVFSDGSLRARIDGMAAELAEAQVRNAARWPAVAPNGGALSSLGGYAGEIEHLKNWLVQRAGWIDTQFVDPPSVPPGGQVAAGTVVEVQPAGAPVWYTIDGSDPRLPGGGVNPSAIAISDGAVETVLVSESSAQVRVLRPTSDIPGATAWTMPGFDDSGWDSGLFGVGYEFSSGYEPYLSTIVHEGSAGAPTSVYVRVPFEVSVPASGFDSLTLRLRYEDGFVAYLNGTPVASSNAPTPLAWNSAATAVRSDALAVGFADFDLSPFAHLVVEGDNLLSIHALNDGDVNASNTGSDSSDMLVSAELLGSFQASNLGEVTIHETTRLIARSYADGSWSGPVYSNFVVGRLADAENLVVSEIMYHPPAPTAAEISAGYSDDGDFEFLELQNISPTETIDLTGVVIRDCFDFDFADAGQTVIPPGGCLLVVRNRAAFELRYGAGLPIAGQWGDATLPDGGSNLSNGGERITLTAADGSVIRDFIYDDALPWPLAADGDGPSLELVTPFRSPDHALGLNWRASATLGGSPGLVPGVFESWAASFFSAEELEDPSVSAPESDPDHDGLANVIELAFGGNPRLASPGLRPSAQLEEIEVDGDSNVYLTITFRRDPSVPGYTATPQFGSSLDVWPDEGVLIATVSHPDGTETVTYRDSTPAPEGRRFVRVRVVGEL